MSNIKVYNNGNEFYEDNKTFLLSNMYTEVFFRLDSPLLTTVNKDEYALLAYENDKKLVVLLKEPYNMLLFGDDELIPTLVDFILDNNYKIKSYFCPSKLGEDIQKYFAKKGILYNLCVGMDFMEAHKRFGPSSDIVEVANEDDIDEICEMTISFIIECGLDDKTEREKIEKSIKDYRIIRCDGKIAAMAKKSVSTGYDVKIACVYTRKEFRGKGFARTICNNILNEALDEGLYATLNVDQKNPISNHVYASIGFTKVFSQSVYMREKNTGDKND